jgi:uncharacterized protein (TIGR00730 family)
MFKVNLLAVLLIFTANSYSMFNDISLNNATLKLKSDIFRINYSAASEQKLSNFKVTFFGGSKIRDNSTFGKAAYDLAQRLAIGGATIITGGGSGIMKAGNCGAAQVKTGRTTSLGITLSGIPSEALNSCMQDQIHFNTFATRKIFLMQLADAFVFFPGGYGTLDELGEVLALIGTNKLRRMPVVLFGKSYWQPLVNWLQNQVFRNGLVSIEHQNLITIVDSVETAERIILNNKIG